MQRIGPYAVEGEVARGGMGAIYRARDPHGRPVALKLLLAHRTYDDRARRRFEAEVEALSRLRHPHVVRLLGAGEHQGVPWVALELVDGESLQRRLRHGPLPIADAVDVTLQLALALQHVHAQGLLHRDLKPDNVLLRGEDALLTDFGLVLDERAESRLTSTGAFLGTPGYWAPEQAQGEIHGLSPRSDLYGLGAVLYACLTGVAPVRASSIQEAVDVERFRAVTPPRRAGGRSRVARRVVHALPGRGSARPPSQRARGRAGPGAQRPRRAAALGSGRLGAGPGRRDLGGDPRRARRARRAGGALRGLHAGRGPRPGRGAEPGRRRAGARGGDGAGQRAPSGRRGPDRRGLGRARPGAGAGPRERARPRLPRGGPRGAAPRGGGPRRLHRRLGAGPQQPAPAPRARLAAPDSRSPCGGVARPRPGAGAGPPRRRRLQPAWQRAARARALRGRPRRLRPGAGAGPRRGRDPRPPRRLPGSARAPRGGAERFGPGAGTGPHRRPDWVNRALSALALGRPAEALRDTDRAMGVGERGGVLFRVRGTALRELGRIEEAIVALRSAVNLEPEDDALAFAQYGICLGQLGRHEEALAAFTRAVELNPTDARSLANRALTLRTLGRPAEALSDYDRVLLQELSARGLSERARTKAQLGRHEAALEDYDRALGLDAAFGPAHLGRGASLGQLERYAEALEAYARGLELAPDDAQGWAERGLCLGELERWAEAVEAYGRALELAPDFAVARFNRALNLEELERYAEAEVDYAAVLEGEPSPDLAQAAREGLERAREAAGR